MCDGIVFPDRAEPTTNTGALSLFVTLPVTRVQYSLWNQNRHQRPRRCGSLVRLMTPGPMPQTVHIFREHEAKIDFGSVQCRESLGAPLLRVFSQARLPGQAREHLQKEAIQFVIGGRTQIRAATVPAPLASVVPVRQSILQPVNSLFKQTAHHRISSFDIQVIKTDKRGHETVENARNRSARNLRVQSVAIHRNPDSGVFDIELKYFCGILEKLQQLGPFRQTPRANQSTDNQALSVCRDPWRLEQHWAVGVIEVHRPNRRAVAARNRILLQPGNLFEESAQVRFIPAPKVVP